MRAPAPDPFPRGGEPPLTQRPQQNDAPACSGLATSGGHALALRHVTWGPSRGRRAGRPIVRDVSLDVAPGELLVIVGPNGAGKSSLLRCIYRAHRPLAGQVLLDGVDVWAMKPRMAAQKIAAVLQEMPGDFPFTVREMVAMGRTPHAAGLWSGAEDHAVIDEALRRLDLTPLAERHWRGLSGGERQRTLLARAIAQQPGLIILDEPTNHLDIRHQLELLQILRGLGLTVVASLHDLTLAAAVADRVLAMRDGAVVAMGAPADVLTPEMIRAVFEVNASVEAEPGGALRFAFSLPSAPLQGSPDAALKRQERRE